MGFQEPQAKAVNRRNPRAVQLTGEIVAAQLLEARADAAAELARRPLGVRDHEQGVHVEPSLAHRLDEPLDQHGRLARAGAGGDEDDAGRVDCGDLLLAGSPDVDAHARFTRHIE
jgi:hypothetical protein